MIQIGKAIAKKFGLPEAYLGFCYLDPQILVIGKAFFTSPLRGDRKLTPDDVYYSVVEIKGVRLYCMFVNVSNIDGIRSIWSTTGTGISTRLAEDLIPHVDSLAEIAGNHQFLDKDITLKSLPEPTFVPEGTAHVQIRERIASLMDRAPAPITPSDIAKTNPEDVYLFPSGMAALFWTHQSITQIRCQKSAGFGCIFLNTQDLLEEFGPGFALFGGGDEEALEELTRWLEAGNRIQALYVEFPSNPIVISAPLRGLRALADKYDFILVVDETIGSFANVDVRAVADVIASSLSKLFSGYADVLAGSVYLNPLSKHYTALKSTFTSSFRNLFYIRDADVLEFNSRDYLERAAITNRNAAAIMALCHQFQTTNADSCVRKVLYPPNTASHNHFRQFMRAETQELTPGYGVLLSIEFDNLESTKAFYDTIEVHSGPHLGAHYTIVLAYNHAMFGTSPALLARASKFNWSSQQIRISVGYEDVNELVEVFEASLIAAENAKIRSGRSHPTIITKLQQQR